jgi:hypothetical protein
MRIFEECFGELSAEAKAEINGLVEKLRFGVKGQDPGKKVQMGWASAGGLLVALIRAGVLPLDCEEAQKTLKLNMRRWGARR